MPVGTLNQNIHCQDRTSVLQPPSIGPAAEEVTIQNEIIVITAVCRCDGNIVYTDANTSGIRAPPLKPCKARKQIMLSIFHAFAQPALARLKNPKHAVNNHRVEIRRDNHPDRGSIITSAINAEVSTQLIWSGPAASPPCISLNELLTICMFVSPKYVPRHITPKETMSRVEGFAVESPLGPRCVCLIVVATLVREPVFSISLSTSQERRGARHGLCQLEP